MHASLNMPPIERHLLTPERHLYRQDYTSTVLPRHVFKDDVASDEPKKLVKTRIYKRKLALLIAAHNEELVIEQTIRSALRAGMKRQDIYIVDDNSSDTTSRIVCEILGKTQTCKVRRSGKGLALTKAMKKFQLCERYQWVHIADADGGFSPDYFHVFRAKLNRKFAAATGYVRSLPGDSVSQYRVVEYTLGLEIHRRFQALVHTIPVIPGPTSCFRTDVLKQLNFANKSMTEDFDVTLQLHRKQLGHIQYIPEAIAYTQDPQTFSDYSKQITRWNRGMLQSMNRHGIGRHGNRIDAYLTYQMLQNLGFFAYIFIFLPLLVYLSHKPSIIATIFLWDIGIMFGIVVGVASKTRRFDILSAFPQIYVLRWLSAMIFLRSYIEVIVLRKFRITNGVWGTAGRRYKTEVNLLAT